MPALVPEVPVRSGDQYTIVRVMLSYLLDIGSIIRDVRQIINYDFGALMIFSKLVRVKKILF